MSVKTKKEIEKMRVAGRLASEVLDIVTPFIEPGISTGELNDICHNHMVKKQKSIPATLSLIHI